MQYNGCIYDHQKKQLRKYFFLNLSSNCLFFTQVQQIIYISMDQHLSQISLEENKRTFKIIILGKSSVGKSSLLLRYVNNYFNPAIKNTIGLDYRLKTQTKNQKNFHLEIWDTAGQEKYRNIVLTYFKSSKGAIIVFDASDPKSLQQTSFWLTQIQTHCGNIPKILVENKHDLIQQQTTKEKNGTIREDLDKKISKIKNRFNVKHFKASAKSGQGVDQLFTYLFEQLYKVYYVLKLNPSNSPITPTTKKTALYHQSSTKQELQKKKQQCC